ncbi:MAG TPA: hypothetical protein VIJ19_01985 [Opitutaceae bacterium]
MQTAKASLLALVSAFGMAGTVSATPDPTLTLTLDSVTPSVAPFNDAGTDFATASGNSGDESFAGLIMGFENVTVTSQANLSVGYPASLSVFCAELAQDIVIGSTGNVYDVEDIQDASSGVGTGLSSNIPLSGIGPVRGGNIEILYGHVFGSTYDTSLLGTNAEIEGFQLAVWKLSQDDGFDITTPGNPASNFWVTSVGGLADPGALAQAQAYLTWVEDNPDAAKMDLVALHSDTGQDLLLPSDTIFAVIPENRFVCCIMGFAALAFGLLRRKPATA